MSSKQLRRLLQREEVQLEVREDEGGNSDDGSADEVATNAAPKQPQRPGFAALANSDSDDDAPDSTNGEAADVGSFEAVRASAPKAKCRQKKKNKKKKGSQATIADHDNGDEGLLDNLLASGEAKLTEGGECPPNGVEATQAHNVLLMRKADFDADEERQRAFGDLPRDSKGVSSGRRQLASRARGGASTGHDGRLVHHRRLVLVTPAPDEPWPRVDDGPQMTAVESETNAGCMPVFRIKSTASSTRARRDLAKILASQDPDNVARFLHDRPFCVEALLAMAEILRSAGEHQQAFKCVRRAVYAVECGFHSGFSPLRPVGVGPSSSRPCVILELPNSGDDPSWPGWSMLAALWTYMLGLDSQGLHRTALEVCKLLLATTLPRDPAHTLVHLDAFCLRARRYDLLSVLASRLIPQNIDSQFEAGDEVKEFSLDRVLPNWAYSLALAKFISASPPAPYSAFVNHVEVSSLFQTSAEDHSSSSGEGSAPKAAAAAMMRAFLLFPQAAPMLLEAAGAKLASPPPSGSPYLSTWNELLARPPFSTASEYKHEKHSAAHCRVAETYALRCGQLWRSDAVLGWAHVCAGRLVQLGESALFNAELTDAQRSWSRSTLGLDAALLHDYLELRATEGASGSEQTPPAIFERAMASLIDSAHVVRDRLTSHVPGEGVGIVHGGPGDGQTAEAAEAPAISDAAIAQLIEMGFAAEAARSALQAAAGDLDTAVAVLFSEA